MPRHPTTAGTPATVVLTEAGVPFTLHTYVHDPSARSYGDEAAALLGLAPEQMFKTLLVNTGAGLAVGVVPVAGSLDLKAMAAALGVKHVVLADPAVAQRVTGYVLGGISPLGQKRRLPTVIDESAELFDVVYVSGGRRGLSLGVAPADLIALTDATVGDIAR
ncbi:MAG TPA: Cys-tRNA(Pro) deacylase [Phycicoccus sp.]|nr:Cys-tRNA(Pro) deacylase [Phycicoccus sp.]